MRSDCHLHVHGVYCLPGAFDPAKTRVHCWQIARTKLHRHFDLCLLQAKRQAKLQRQEEEERSKKEKAKADSKKKDQDGADGISSEVTFCQNRCHLQPTSNKAIPCETQDTSHDDGVTLSMRHSHSRRTMSRGYVFAVVRILSYLHRTLTSLPAIDRVTKRTGRRRRIMRRKC